MKRRNSLCLNEMEFSIEQTWDSKPVAHTPVKIRFSPGDGGLKMEVCALFFNDPEAPAAPPAQPFPGLWDYEVVESFFLNNSSEQYLEIELCPHGQHLVLLLNGKHNAFMQQLPLVFSVCIAGASWKGEALLPWRFFPPGVNKMNSYSIHGSGAERTYQSLYPIPHDELLPSQGPDFHRLEYFQPFHLQSIMGGDWVQPESDLWKRVS